MKKALSLIVVFVMLLTLAACTPGVHPTVSPTDGAQTEAPAATDDGAATEEATEAPTEEATEAPVTGSVDYCMALTPDEALTCDVDFDGLDDTVLLETVSKNEYDEYEYKLVLTRGADAENPKEYDVERCYDCFAWVIDSDASDSRLEVILSFVQDSDDWTSAAMRVNDDGSDVSVFEDWVSIGISAECPFTTENGFAVSRQTDIFGTTYITANARVTAKGFEILTDYAYPTEQDEELFARELKRDMDVVILNEDGSEGESYTVPAGEKVIPVRTDDASFLDLKLPDGRLGRVTVEVKTGDEWGIYINGVNQDEYADMPYAD